MNPSGYVSTMSPRPGWIFGDPRELVRTRSRRKNRLQSATSLEKGCAVANLCYCGFTLSNPVSPTNPKPRVQEPFPPARGLLSS